jgi:phage terminase large subunit
MKMPEITIEVYVDDVMNDWAVPILDDASRYLVLYGGAGSGKSVAAAQKLVLRMLEEEGHKFLVIRKVANTLRNSVYALIRETISEWGLTEHFKINKGDMKITCNTNGNEIIFAGIDDPEKLKSIHGVTGMWIEEASELEQQDFQQLDLRLRGFTMNYKQIMITFNPISSLHWLKELFFDRKKKDSTVIHSTYLNNKFIDNTYKQVLESMKEEDEYYYMVYALGEWGVIGKTIFSAQKVNERISAIRDKKPLKRGYFTYEYKNEKIIDGSIKWVEDENGSIEIWEEPRKVDEHGNSVMYPYVFGGDTSGEGSDYFAGHMLDNITGKQVAIVHHQFDEDLFARQVYCLGKYYNYALVSIEVNFSTYPIKELQRLGYARQYRREVIDEISNKKQHKYGFRTTTTSRPVIIAELVQIVRENIHLINDVKTLNEMLTFVRNEKGKPEAQEGKKDDLIISLGIAHKAREQQAMRVITNEYDEPDYEVAFGNTGY